MLRILILLLLALPLGAQEDLRVLFIGNSLTYWNEMPWMLERVAESKNRTLKAAFSGGSGMSLKQHWQRGRALKAIGSERWDYVVLQGQSSEPTAAPNEFARYAKMFDAEIRKRGAKTILLETWAPQEAPERQAEISKRYADAARALGARLAPMAKAWHRTRAQGIETYGDHLHPSLAGSYLTACLFYALLFGQTPAGATHVFDVQFEIDEFYRRALEHDRIDAATAAAIQRIAWETVR